MRDELGQYFVPCCNGEYIALNVLLIQQNIFILIHLDPSVGPTVIDGLLHYHLI